MEGAVEGYRSFLEFMTREYVPGARATIGASELPRGREYYARLVKSYTTLDVTPDEVHQIGLREVERIRAEMTDVIHEILTVHRDGPPSGEKPTGITLAPGRSGEAQTPPSGVATPTASGAKQRGPRGGSAETGLGAAPQKSVIFPSWMITSSV